MSWLVAILAAAIVALGVAVDKAERRLVDAQRASCERELIDRVRDAGTDADLMAVGLDTANAARAVGDESLAQRYLRLRERALLRNRSRVAGLRASPSRLSVVEGDATASVSMAGVRRACVRTYPKAGVLP